MVGLRRDDAFHGPDGHDVMTLLSPEQNGFAATKMGEPAGREQEGTLIDTADRYRGDRHGSVTMPLQNC